MLFNSITFLLFFAIVFGLSWAARSERVQNLILIVSSFIFYGWLDFRFCALLFLSVITAWMTGQLKSKRGVWVAVCVNLSVLFFFKYCNFFIESLQACCSVLGLRVDIPTISIVLPLGVSFYSLMSISYVVDVYKGKIAPAKDPIAFCAYMSFFPQLLAGPIGRAPGLLPQFSARRTFDCRAVTSGLALFCLGLFKKIVVADTLCLYVDSVFSRAQLFDSLTCALGIVFFALQIFADFSGYSDMACGVGRMLGIDLMENFNRPYFATSVSDFWRRWHISLSTWFRDYVYIPLGGSRCGLFRQIRNTWIVFLLSGLWHGAAWTYVIWGAIHAFYLTISILTKKWNSRFAFLRLRQGVVLLLVGLAWVAFRAKDSLEMFIYIRKLLAMEFSFSPSVLFAGIGPVQFGFCVVAVFLLALSHWVPKDCVFRSLRRTIAFCILCLAAILVLGTPSSGEFIYSQF